MVYIFLFLTMLHLRQQKVTLTQCLKLLLNTLNGKIFNSHINMIITLTKQILQRKKKNYQVLDFYKSGLQFLKCNNE